MKTRRRLLATALLFALAPLAQAQQGDGTDVHIDTNVWKPALVPADAAHISRLRVPHGFAVNVFARNLGNPRILAVAPDGNVYVSRRDQGDVMLLRDDDRDGRADGPATWVAHIAGTHGL